MANNNFMTAAETPNFMIWFSGPDGATLLDEQGSTIFGVVDIPVDTPIVTGASNPGSANLTDHAILYSSSFAMKKVISPNSGSDLYSAARIQGTPLRVLIANGHYVATLEDYFVRGKTLAIISIVKLANLPVNSNADYDQLQMPTVTERNIFEDCFILSIEPKYDSKTNMDMLQMDIRYNKRTHTIFKYNQYGDLLGNNESVYDFSQNVTTTKGFDDSSAATASGN